MFPGRGGNEGGLISLTRWPPPPVTHPGGSFTSRRRPAPRCAPAEAPSAR